MSDTITLSYQSFLMAMLNGAWYDCKSVPIDVGDALKAQDPNEEHIVLVKPSCSAMFYELWSKEGWANEQTRQTYVATLTGPTIDLVKQKPKDFKTQIQEALEKEDWKLVARLQAERKETS